MSELITPDLVRLDVGLGSDKQDVIRALAAVVAESGRTGNAEGLATDVLAREATSATGMPGGIAIPHCRTEHVDVPTLAFARLSPPTDFGAKDGPADLTFLIAAPAGGDATHLQLLTQLARSLVKKDFTDSLRAAETSEEALRPIQDDGYEWSVAERDVEGLPLPCSRSWAARQDATAPDARCRARSAPLDR